LISGEFKLCIKDFWLDPIGQAIYFNEQPLCLFGFGSKPVEIGVKIKKIETDGLDPNN
jgi:hypothetical protein